MRALRYTSYGGPVRVVDVPSPSCPRDGVLVRVGATGVCRSDWHAWQGHDPVPLPMVPGHELAGVVAEVGPDVPSAAGWAVGDRVTAPFVMGCGRCADCRAGAAQVCADQQQPGFTYDGSFAEVVAVPAVATNLVRLPDDLDVVAAAALGGRFATAHRAVAARGGLGAGEWLLVVGCGGLGLSAVAVGRALGARVVAADVVPAALEEARAAGAEAVLEVPTGSDGPERLARAVRDVTDGGAHVALDAVGSPAALAGGGLSLRRRGRHVQAGLLLGDAARSAVPMDRVVAWELDLLGSHGMAAADYPPMLDLVARAGIDLGSLVAGTAPLEAGGEVLASLGGAGRGVTVLVP
ncbi:MAG: alcohol dehydrogenase [Nocardioides sp.]|nr:alcohol dehydrogenase [Nocardioides sp.]